jgi:N-acetyl-anhydromuramyl-L-alanine amidase AmpD
MPKPAFNERIQWSPNFSSRPLAGIDYEALHTQEGDGTAASLANYASQASSQISYHYMVDNGVNVVDSVDTDDSSWSVGNANDRVINICFAGSRASWTRTQWLNNMGKAIEVAAWISVRDALQYKFDAVVRGWDELKAGKTGITDHRGINMGVLRTPGHTDVGDNFPWDVFAGHVDRFRTQGLADVAPQPVDNRTAIEYCRDANDWLGVKVTPAREEKTPDGKGRYVHYEKGSVYWSPDVDGGKAAFAVPLDIRDKWSKEGWETGFLGYPIKPKLDLVPFNRSDGRPVRGGVVQAFQGGTVYSSDLGTFWVRGLVKDRFASLGYETKDVGWPKSDEVSFGDANYGGSYQIFEHAQIMWFNQGNSTVALELDDNGALTGKVLLPLAQG